ncbi:hypothetical protein M438DRAFT_386309 [Aureobasidium pullulans EXF-150]|uniref:Uncharacterized protein n=1 Tax=Aureobasidium pullulans EXF-150 TaxID=1043002 RepID=A0A074XZ64_AURPU|nr:uncharacterized protein M438DRAFT_386309 [Aureobasidium pullulans EXF-150]KEQ79976.1 hypothetical protein M438DRAFT_386309 [Aureobasidium pullulans EXF-150]
MYLTVYCVLAVLILRLASAIDEPYVGLSLGSRTVTLANLTDSGNVSIIAQLPVDSAYISWFQQAVELKPKYEIPADNAALIDVLQAARNVLEAASADNTYISVIALPWKLRTHKLDEIIIDALTDASMLDPRPKEILRLTMIETRHVVQIAYGFDLPQNLGLPKDFDWSAKVEPLVLHIEYNWNFMGFQLIHIYKAAASLEHDAMFKGFTDVNYLGTDQKSATGIENQLSAFLAKHIRPPGPSTPPGDHFYIPDLRAVTFSGDAPPHAFDVLRTAVEKVMGDYPYAQLYDTIRPSELFAVGAAKYAQFLVEFHRDFNPHGGHEEL